MTEQKCVVCGKKAWKSFSPDLDIQGIGTCKKHIEQVRLAYLCLLQGGEDMYKKLIAEEFLPKLKGN